VPSPIRVAVIGAGNMGRNHIRKYAGLKESELLAIADVDPSTEKLAKEYGAKFYLDYKEMLDKERPQAVSIVAPTPFHHAIASDVIGRGIHCLLEKPIANTVEQATELIDLAKNKKVILTIGHIERYNPVIRKLKDILSNGAVGEITSIVCRRVGGFPAAEPKTDVIIDLAVHDIDMMSYLLGRYPLSVYSHGSRTLHTNRIDSAEILMDYGTASGFVQANWITPVKIRTIAVTGSKGYVEANYITQELVHYKNNMERVNRGFESFVKTFGDPVEEKIKVEFVEPLEVEILAFIDAINTNNTSDIVDPKDAREALRIALKSVEKYE